MKSSQSVDRVKGILGIYQEGRFNIMLIEDESHGMDRCFTATHLTCTHLQWASGILNVGKKDPQDGFGDDSSWDLTMQIGLTPGDLSSGIRRHTETLWVN